MPRKAVNASMAKINKARGENYISHFECRQFALSVDESLRVRVANALEVMPRPALNVFACVSMSYYFEPTTWQTIMQAGRFLSMDASYLLWWYWSDAGWDEFQRQFKDLPELYTGDVYKSEVVHMQTVYEHLHSGKS